MPEQIVNLVDALNIVNRTFQDYFDRMDFFFCYKDKKTRTIFNVIRSLPNIYLDLEDESQRQVVFESTWTNINNNSSRPSPTGSRRLKAIPTRKPAHYFAHSFMGIPLIHQVNVFEYGFEILSESGIDMIAIKSECLEDQSINYIRDIVGHTFWALPPVRSNILKEVICYWRMPTTDEFDEYMRKKQRGEIKEAKRDLIVGDL